MFAFTGPCLELSLLHFADEALLRRCCPVLNQLRVCCRRTGAARFRLGNLARHGRLIAIPYNDVTVKRVRSELEAALKPC